MKYLSLLLLLTSFALPALSQQVPGKLRVVAKPAEPFVFESKGEINGYSIDLWRRIAKDAGLEFDIKLLKTVPEVLEAVQKGEADAGTILVVAVDRPQHHRRPRKSHGFHAAVLR